MFHSPASQPVAVFLTAIIPALLLNIYIVGLNQYFDIPIDRINKPYLPLASGALTKPDAQLTIALSAILGLLFCLAPLATPALRVVLIGSAILGTIYSAPPFRLKRFALLASILILAVRGLLVNIGFFLHSSAGNLLPPVILFASTFFTFFGIVIALLKDVPDIRGDMVFGIRTFSVRLGADKVFNACVCTLVVMFMAAATFYFRIAHSTIGLVIAGVHVVVAAMLWQRSRVVSTNAPEQLYEYYMLSWKMFYLEYVLLPFVAL
ncbi:putative homogentisate phytyltransferase 1, chloroplastic [Gracilariopsis chorda]|uniref:Putative homogentisate phytyltransferase 1, chloroplastic n=1 Tax=Gracilariopsis chorda TaxID=448386 RepID=A0A2V3IZN8_9FLOR|nr:putative homogentisate phytyltransferase 1, chloroplastic [Gracilariopsis chorda]|eukprot:PXF47147.1 putative homogentisate phytyltransferase 1, chloroplastic [Gracilariopsis chorda]